MHAIQVGPSFVAIQTVQHDNAQMRRETLQFRRPVGHQRGGHHHQRGTVQPSGFFLDRDMGDGLRGLAQPHIVRQQCAQVVFPQVL